MDIYIVESIYYVTSLPRIPLALPFVTVSLPCCFNVVEFQIIRAENFKSTFGWADCIPVSVLALLIVVARGAIISITQIMQLRRKVLFYSKNLQTRTKLFGKSLQNNYI